MAEGYIANSRPLRLEKMNMLKPDRLKKEDKEKERKLEAENLLNALDVARKPSTQVMEIFMEKPEQVELLPDRILSQLEVDSSDEEPKKKRLKWVWLKRMWLTCAQKRVDLCTLTVM